MVKLHAGGKFDHDRYKVPAVCTAWVASVVNALSEWCEVEVCRDGVVYQMEFKGGHKTSELKKIGTRRERHQDHSNT